METPLALTASPIGKVNTGTSAYQVQTYSAVTSSRNGYRAVGRVSEPGKLKCIPARAPSGCRGKGSGAILISTLSPSASFVVPILLDIIYVIGETIDLVRRGFKPRMSVVS